MGHGFGFTVQDGVWTQNGDFAKKGTYDGKSVNFAGMTSDGHRVFIGESGGAARGTTEVYKVSASEPAATNALIAGAGVLFADNRQQAFEWTAAGGALAPCPTMLSLSRWRNYLDLEVVGGHMWYTEPEFGTLWTRTGEDTDLATVTGLCTPT